MKKTHRAILTLYIGLLGLIMVFICFDFIYHIIFKNYEFKFHYIEISVLSISFLISFLSVPSLIFNIRKFRFYNHNYLRNNKYSNISGLKPIKFDKLIWVGYISFSIMTIVFAVHLLIGITFQSGIIFCIIIFFACVILIDAFKNKKNNVNTSQMSEMPNKLDIQSISISNEKWTVKLHYESWSTNKKAILETNNDTIIELSKKGEWTSALKLEIIDLNDKTTNCLINGIDSGNYFHLSKETNDGQSVKLTENNIILSIGFNLISLDLTTLKLNWKIRPDIAGIFEFYDLGDDILLRGEIGIHRIDLNGKVKWTFSARDIWVNMEGRREVNIEEKQIRLFDFDNNEYLIDLNGKLLENISKKKRI